eukprot:s2754_g16.t1
MKDLHMAHRTLHNRRLGRCSLDFIEYFSGHGELSKSVIHFGLEAMSSDWIHSGEHDALSRRGLRLFLAALSGAKPHALTWFGTVCSSFVVLCRAQSERQWSNNFAGNVSLNFLMMGNRLAAVSSLIYLLSDMVGNFPVLEQPLNSCMPLYSMMNAVLTFCRSCKISTYHGAFGAETAKPFQLLSVSSKINSLTRTKPYVETNHADLLVTRDENGGFTGQKQQLVQGQA